MKTLRMANDRTRWLLLTGLLATSMLVPLADAQAQVEEITVTARKREERLQDVPVAVSTIGPQQILRENVSSIRDVVRLTPGLTIDQGSSGPDVRLTIRGISTIRGQPSVAILVDGVDVTTQALVTPGGGSLANLRLLDLERVEVVKGPQSTTFGRSAFAGAVNYVTKKPTEWWEGGVSGEISQGGHFDVQGNVAGPIIPGKVLFRVNAASHDLDGYYKNAIDGSNVGDERSRGGRVQVTFLPTDKLTINASGEYSREAYGQRAVALDAGNTTVAYPAPIIGNLGRTLTTVIYRGDVTGDESRIQYTPGEYGTIVRTARATLDMNYDFGFATLQSISGFVTQNLQQAEDVTYTYQPAQSASSTRQRGFTGQRFLQASEDLRLTSNNTGRFKWQGGLYYWHEEAKISDQTESYFGRCDATNVGLLPGARCAVGPGLVPNKPDTVPFAESARKTNHVSAYGSLSYEILPRLTLTGEARIATETTKAHIQLFRTTVPGFIPGGVLAFPTGSLTSRTVLDLYGITGYTPYFDGASTTTYYFNPRGTVDYKLTDDVLLYGTYAKGTKPGGVSLISGTTLLQDSAYRPEKLNSFELGMKSEWFDRKLVFNADGFFERYSNQQVPIQNFSGPVPVTTVVNAGVANAWGIELQAQFKPTTEWTIGAAYTYQEAKYGSFNGQSSSQKAVAKTFTVFGPTGTPLVFADLRGYTLPQVAQNQGNVDVRYQTPINLGGGFWSDVEVFGEGIVTYSSKRFPGGDVINQGTIPGWSTTDLRAGLETKRWNVTLFVDNVFDDRTIRSASNYVNESSASGADTSPLAYLPNPRTVGVRFSYKWGGPAMAMPATAAATTMVAQRPVMPKSYLVFFDFDRSDLTPEAIKIVDTAAANAKAGSVTRIEVTGHADRSGSDAYNVRLSQRRADTVKAKLLADGFTQGEIVTFAKGESQPLVPTADGVREPQNRRVEIIYK